MTRGVSALMRKIEIEEAQAAQAERDQRLAIARGATVRRRTKWAIDHLMDTGQIQPEQHDAAERYARTRAAALAPPKLSASQLVAVFPGWDLSFATEIDRAARAIGKEHARVTVQAARSWVAKAPRTNKARLVLMENLFAYPQPSWRVIRARDPVDMPGRVSSLLDVLVAFWDSMDAGYGPLDKTNRVGDHFCNDAFARPG